MPYRRGRSRFKTMAKMPMHYVKHIVQEKEQIAPNDLRAEILVLAPLGDETTATSGTRTRDVNVSIGDKIFSINYEIILRPNVVPVEGFYEVCWTFHRSPDVFSAELTDINNDGLAKDLIGRYSGNCLYTRMSPMSNNVGGYMRGTLKLPKSKQSFRQGDSLVCSIHNHGSVASEYMGKFIYKAYH